MTILTPEKWTAQFVDRICAYYGSEARRRAEEAARVYLSDGDIRDDPDAAAILVMEGWAMASSK